VLNNLEFDHADIFPDLAAIETQFHHLVRCVPSGGALVVNGRDEALARVLARGCWSAVEHFDAPQGWHLRGEAGAQELWRGDARIGAFSLPLDGAHNRSNALAAIAAAAHAGVDPAAALEAVRDFPGVKRRMELRGTVRGVSVYDDFAHHATAIDATLAGLRARVGAARVLALLEPRSNTMKLGTLQARLPAALAHADRTWVLAAGEGPQALGWDARAALAPLGERARVCVDVATLVREVAAAARPGDHVVAMSNGGFGGVHAKLLSALENGKEAGTCD